VKGLSHQIGMGWKWYSLRRLDGKRYVFNRRVDRVPGLFFQSSELGPQQPQTSMFTPLCGRDTLACGRGGWGGPSSDEGTDTVVLDYMEAHQKVHIYRVPQCMSPRWNWDSPNPSLATRQRLCLSPELKGGRAHSPAGEGVGESQFRRLEKKFSTLPTL
jgi:hypothetical protein